MFVSHSWQQGMTMLCNDVLANIVIRITFCVVQTTLQKIGLHQVQALSETISAELAMSGVSCVLSWHVLSEGR